MIESEIGYFFLLNKEKKKKKKKKIPLLRLNELAAIVVLTSKVQPSNVSSGYDSTTNGAAATTASMHGN